MSVSLPPGAGTDAQGTNGPCVQPLPTSLPGDLLVQTISLLGASPTVTPPAGWTLLGNGSQISGTTVNIFVFYKVAGPSEPASFSFAVPAGSYWSGTMFAYRSTIAMDVNSCYDITFGGQTTAVLQLIAPQKDNVAGEMLQSWSGCYNYDGGAGVAITGSFWTPAFQNTNPNQASFLTQGAVKSQAGNTAVTFKASNTGSPRPWVNCTFRIRDGAPTAQPLAFCEA